MNLPSVRRLPLLALAAVALATLGGNARAAEVPFAGTWKLTVFEGPQIINLVLVKVEEADGKPSAKIINAGLPNFAGATLENVKVEAKAVRFTLKNGPASFIVNAYPRKSDEKPSRLYGTMKIGPNTILALLDNTKDTEIDRTKGIVPNDTAATLARLAAAKPEEQEKGLNALIKDKANEPAA